MSSDAPPHVAAVEERDLLFDAVFENLDSFSFRSVMYLFVDSSR